MILQQTHDDFIHDNALNDRNRQFSETPANEGAFMTNKTLAHITATSMILLNLKTISMNFPTKCREKTTPNHR
jgi:hypothetical protein